MNARVGFSILVTAAAAMICAKALAVEQYYAQLTANGAVTLSSGLHAASHDSTGQYTLTFNRNIAGCSYVAAVTGTSKGFATARRSGGNNVIVLVSNSTGTAADIQFTVQLLCAP